MPPLQLAPSVQLWIGGPGMQVPRLSQMKLPNLAQSASFLQTPVSLQLPFWQ